VAALFPIKQEEKHDKFVTRPLTDNAFFQKEMEKRSEKMLIRKRSAETEVL